MAAARAKYTQQLVQDSGELEKEAEDDRKAEAAEAAQDAHKTADHAPGLEATLDQDMWARDHGHTYDAGAYQLGESLPATLRDQLLRQFSSPEHCLVGCTRSTS